MTDLPVRRQTCASGDDLRSGERPAPTYRVLATHHGNGLDAVRDAPSIKSRPWWRRRAPSSQRRDSATAIRASGEHELAGSVIARPAVRRYRVEAGALVGLLAREMTLPASQRPSTTDRAAAATRGCQVNAQSRANTRMRTNTRARVDAQLRSICGPHRTDLILPGSIPSMIGSKA